MTALARLRELQSFGLPLLVGASRKRFISTVTPSEPHQRLGGSIAAHLDCRAERARGSSARMMWRKPCRRCGWRPQSGTGMTDTIFITGVVIHARHGVMEHETEVGQRFVIDLELYDRPVGILAHRPPCRHRILFQCGRDGDGGLQEHQLQTAGARGRRRCGRHTGDISAHQRRQGHRSQAARADRRDLRGCRRGPDPHAASVAWLTR